MQDIINDSLTTMVFFVPNDFVIPDVHLDDVYKYIPYFNGEINLVQFYKINSGKNNCTRFYSLDNGMIHSTIKEAFYLFVDDKLGGKFHFLYDVEFSKEEWELQKMVRHM